MKIPSVYNHIHHHPSILSVFDNGGFFGINFNSTGRDNESKVFGAFDTKFGLVLMLELVLTVYENIIEVSSAKHIQIVKKNVVHIALACGRIIGKSKWKDFALVSSVLGPKRVVIL